MIIVVFHVLYLIGKMVYEKYYSAKPNDENVQELYQPAKIPLNLDAPDPLAANTDDIEDGSGGPRFSPPAYLQRYMAVQDVLADPKYEGKIKKVVDFGCSELGFINHLKNTPGIQEILCIDIDRATLEQNKVKAVPLNADFLRSRPNPLTIHVYEGSVVESDNKLANSDAVVAIELIEHLYPNTLMDFPYNIFGYIKPLVVAITTPNADFNVLFSLKNEFRHWDHKFEWTRQQFEDWANNIVLRYPEYQVSFQGIGAGPTGEEHLGYCSQMAVFNRIREAEGPPVFGREGLFKLVTSQEYPYRVDNRSDEQKILDEASYYIRRFTQNNPECLEEYPLKTLLKHLEKFNISAVTLREILENGGYALVDHEDDAAILCPALSNLSDLVDELLRDEVNDNIEDERDADYVRESSPYRDNFGTSGEGNAEAMYDDECWDDDYEIPVTYIRANDEVEDSVEPDNCNELELTRSLDTADFNDLEISNVSHVPSLLEPIEPNGLSPFLESYESTEDNTLDRVKVSSNIPITENSIFSQNQSSSVECKTEAVTNANGATSQTKSSSTLEEAQRLEECSTDSLEVGSMCSMYLEASRNDERDAYPEISANRTFDCTPMECSFEESGNPVGAATSASALDSAAPELQVHRRLSTLSALGNDLLTQPQFSSSPERSNPAGRHHIGDNNKEEVSQKPNDGTC